MKTNLYNFTVMLIMGVFILSCGKSSSNKKNDATLSDTLNKDSVTEAIKTDSLVIDTIEFPSEATYAGKLLKPGIFHNEEVWETAASEKWVGLFKNKQGYYTAEVKIKTGRIKDEMVDEGTSNKTGWKITTNIKDSALCLISGIELSPISKIESAGLNGKQIMPGDSISFKYLNINYVIYATGIVKKGEWEEINNYKLYLKTQKEGKTSIELLAAEPGFNDTMIEILFAGDADGDGILDLLINCSNHYNRTRPTLFLSKYADPGHILKVVAQHNTVGC
jgi:hypothetical protein